jgi:glyoxylase-like metal-dependent hydrolase (beta-lactamase superfamily II)
LNVPIWAHAATAERLAGKVAVQRSLDHGERITLDGAEPLTLECVHTPGHAPGHLCFWAREARALIAGDMVASVGTILVDTKDGDMQRYLDSLRAMDELDAQQLLPAHGLPIHDARARLHYYVQHRLAREAKVYAALADLGRAARSDELLPRAYADTPKAAWPFAALAIEAHLVKLEREERVERQGATWRAR